MSFDFTETNRQYLSSGSESGANSSSGKSSNMLDLLGIDLENNDAVKNGTVATSTADPWGMPIKTQPQPPVIHIYILLIIKKYIYI